LGDESSSIGGKVKISLADMDLPSWEHELKVDLEIIDLAGVDEQDHARRRRQAPAPEGPNSGEDRTPINPGNKKVLIFTAFADTLTTCTPTWRRSLLAKQTMHTGKVTARVRPKSTLKPTRATTSRNCSRCFAALQGEGIVLPNEPGEFDLLIGTDCISEGQNLQDCDYLINYDIHWNPVRIIQRFGRVDRIGSPNAASSWSTTGPTSRSTSTSTSRSGSRAG
jgi:hypothetical protein